jgi:methylitaconate Delta-isomerase
MSNTDLAQATDVQAFPCSIVRGGTSRALIFREADLPTDAAERSAVLMAAVGSGDPRQIDGLGGADQLTSKVAVIGPSTRSDADADYTFGQVGIDEAGIDLAGNCGNISAAAALFAAGETFVTRTEPFTRVRLHNTNTRRILTTWVPVEKGVVARDGDYVMPGVAQPGVEIRLDFAATAGTQTGRLLPTGNPIDLLEVPELGRTVEVSIVDAAKLAVYFDMAEIGLRPSDHPDEVDSDVLARFVAVHRAAAALLDLDLALELPRPTAMAAPVPYPLYTGDRIIEPDEIDVVGRWVGHMAPPMRVRKAFAGTGAVTTAIAARIPGTIVHRLARPNDKDEVRIGHPSGVFAVRVVGEPDDLREVTFSRSARLIASGTTFVRVP